MELLFAAVEARGYVDELLEKLLDPIGVVGLLGQGIFAGRMVVQWWVSEKRGASVVPKVFWHMSLWGSVLVLVYGACRREPLILLGQAPPLFIYVRNLVLMSRGGQIESPTVSKFDSSTNAQGASKQELRATGEGLADPLDSPLGPR